MILGITAVFVEVNITKCHAELVSAPHLLSILHAEHLSCGVMKQGQDDFFF
ncbi:hypothetical protein FHS10_000613 [Mucilaginibacter dorajii]|nr:hypothetical protein [Mucilaginibacter dorajii]